MKARAQFSKKDNIKSKNGQSKMENNIQKRDKFLKKFKNGFHLGATIAPKKCLEQNLINSSICLTLNT